MAPIDEERMPTLQEITEHGAEIPEKRAAPVSREIFQNVGDQVQLEEGEDQKVVEEIESLCMNCEKNGTTRLLLTRIPFFREVILMSFNCPHCHLSNTEVQSAGRIQEQGNKTSLTVDAESDLQRQVVKSDTAVFTVEDLELEVPAGRGRLTNVEGLLSEIVEDLGKDQEQRKKELPELYEKLQIIVERLEAFATGRAFPFTISLNDPAGNSTIEPRPGNEQTAGKYKVLKYDRTLQQNVSLGLAEPNALAAEGSAATNGTAEGPATNEPPSNFDLLRNMAASQQVAAATESGAAVGAEGGELGDMEILQGQVYTLPVSCPGCTKPADMNMQMVNIPYFKQVIISAVVCNSCGYRTNEVKTGGEVPARGKRIFLKVKRAEDLSRDILKSETCMLKVPACSVEVQPGTMGGRFTTVEGLLTQMRNDLRKSIFDIEPEENTSSSTAHDGMDNNTAEAWNTFFAKLDSALRAEFEFEVELEDPLANSYVQSMNDDGSLDDQLRTEEYDRTAEEEEDLGLSDMRTKMNEQGEYIREDAAETAAAGGGNHTATEGWSGAREEERHTS